MYVLFSNTIASETDAKWMTFDRLSVHCWPLGGNRGSGQEKGLAIASQQLPTSPYQTHPGSDTHCTPVEAHSALCHFWHHYTRPVRPATAPHSSIPTLVAVGVVVVGASKVL